MQKQHFNQINNNSAIYWLTSVLIAVIIMVFIGGVTRLTDSVETALKVGFGSMTLEQLPKTTDQNMTKETMMFSEKFACAHCGISLPDFEPRSFSFSSNNYRSSSICNSS